MLFFNILLGLLFFNNLLGSRMRFFGPRPDLGFAQLHAHIEPFPEWPALVQVGEAACLPGYVCPDHRHQVYELTYVVSGCGVREVGTRSDTVVARDFHLVRPNEIHRSRADATHPYRVCYLQVDPQHLPAAAAKDVADAFAELGAQPARVVSGAAGAENAFRRLLDELDRCETAARRERALGLAMTQALAVEILIRFTRGMFAGDAAAAAPTPERRIFQEITAWLRTRLADPPSLAEMAKRAGLSPGHFTNAFKREVGPTPIDFLTALRIDEATRRLHTSDQTISSIAADLGFASPGYFAQVFSKVKGCTPSEWRARHGL